jgi:hypothetical protein
MGMHPDDTPRITEHLDLDQELERLLRERPERVRPDNRGPRGNQETETADVERGRDNLERVLGW